MKKDNKILTVFPDTSNDKEKDIALKIEAWKKAEAFVKAYEAEIEMIKKEIKELEVDKIVIHNDKGFITCSITNFVQNRSSLNKERVEAAIGDSKIFESCFDTKEIKSVRITLK